MSSADRMAVDMNVAGAGAVAIDTAVAASVASGIEVLRHILRQYSTNWHLLQLNERCDRLSLLTMTKLCKISQG